MPVSSQIGAKKESSWNTPVTVDRFFEFESESVQGGYGRTESAPLRVGQSGLRSARYVPYFEGAAGPVVMVPLSKGFGFWLEHMLGAVATTGPVDSAYTHTGTTGELLGKSFTFQADRPFYPSGTDQAFTYSGGKIVDWELKCAPLAMLDVTLNMDFASESTATALATASYPSGTVEPFYWTKGQILIGGAAVPLTAFSLKCNNNLKTDIRHLNNTAVKSEQGRNNLREITVDLTADFSDLATAWNRYSAATPGSIETTLVATFQAPTLIGATTYPSLVVTLPALRLDGTEPTVQNLDPMMQQITGKALVHPTNGHISVAYTTLDTTP